MSLKTFRDMKTEIGVQLSNLIRFYWKVYLRKKENAKKKKKKATTKKGKGKAKRAAVQPSMSTQVLPTKHNFSRTNSIVSSTAVHDSPRKLSVAVKQDPMSQTMNPKGSNDKKVVAKDNGQSVDLSTDDQFFGNVAAAAVDRRETMQPMSQMPQIREEASEHNELLLQDSSAAIFKN